MRAGWYTRIKMYDDTRKELPLSAATFAEAVKQVSRLEAKQLDIRNGLLPRPTMADKAAGRPIEEVMAEYLKAGRSCGGRRGKPWSKCHADKKEKYLNWWIETLSFTSLADVKGCLPAVEKALRGVEISGLPDKRKKGPCKPLSGKSVNLILEALYSFFEWCALPMRKYLLENP